ncbi:MAG: CDP-alcohol phosphatidyltransferase family protein [bacterium]
MDYLNIPNFITLSRYFLIPPIIYFSIFRDGRPVWVIIILFGLFMLSDLLDGIVARRLGKVTEFGKAFDTIADKSLAFPLIVLLFIYRLLPLWFVISVAVKEALSIYIALSYIRRIGGVLQSNIFGKVYINLSAVALLSFIIDIRELFIFLSIMALISGYYSQIIYYRSFISAYKEVCKRDEDL